MGDVCRTCCSIPINEQQYTMNMVKESSVFLTQSDDSEDEKIASLRLKLPADNLAIQTTCDKISTAVNKYSKYIEGKSFTDRDQLEAYDEMNEATVHFDTSKIAIYETKPTETDLEP